jgi:hypothetical protein
MSTSERLSQLIGVKIDESLREVVLAVLEVCIAAANTTFAFSWPRSLVAATATSLPGDAADDHLLVTQLMAVDLGRPGSDYNV